MVLTGKTRAGAGAPGRYTGTRDRLARLDDFVTGYSSLAYPRRFPVHTLKIDRIFIQEMLESGEAHILVDATIALGHSLGTQALSLRPNTVGKGLPTYSASTKRRDGACYHATTECPLLAQTFLDLPERSQPGSMLGDGTAELAVRRQGHGVLAEIAIEHTKPGLAAAS